MVKRLKIRLNLSLIKSTFFSKYRGSLNFKRSNLLAASKSASGKMPHLVLIDVPQEFLDVKKAYQFVSF